MDRINWTRSGQGKNWRIFPPSGSLLTKLAHLPTLVFPSFRIRTIASGISARSGKYRTNFRLNLVETLDKRCEKGTRKRERLTQRLTFYIYIYFSVAPVCKEDRIVVVGASRGESLNIACKVEADPPAHNFRWKFNNSGETLEVAQGRFSMETSSGVSVFRYTPTTELDYGTLSCWADNSVGRQARPCLFQLIAAGKYLRHGFSVNVTPTSPFEWSGNRVKILSTLGNEQVCAPQLPTFALPPAFYTFPSVQIRHFVQTRSRHTGDISRAFLPSLSLSRGGEKKTVGICWINGQIPNV